MSRVELLDVVTIEALAGLEKIEILLGELAGFDGPIGLTQLRQSVSKE